MAKKRLLEKLQELLMDELDEDEVEELVPSPPPEEPPAHEIPQETFELVNAAYVAVQEAQTQYATLVPQLEAQKAALWDLLREARKALNEQVTNARDECGVPDEPGWTLNFPDEDNAFPNFSKKEEEE